MKAKTLAAATGAVALAAAGVPLALAGSSQAAPNQTTFHMVRSVGAVTAGCLEDARARVTITQRGPVEVMDVTASGLPAHREFDLFVTQVPDAPFGMSWYQGDMETDEHGRASGRFIGRFNEETFIVAPNTANAPTPHDGLDASSNPATGPIHTFHLGLWFNSPRVAARAGCGNAVTPFNGEHNAGVQALSTTQFADQNGPLGQITP